MAAKSWSKKSLSSPHIIYSSELSGTAASNAPVLSAQGDSKQQWLTDSQQRKTDMLGRNLAPVTIPTWINMRLNPKPRCGKRATKRLSYDAAYKPEK
jgi:hypothetical protein